jgi:hypothetical protein
MESEGAVRVVSVGIVHSLKFKSFVKVVVEQPDNEVNPIACGTNRFLSIQIAKKIVLLDDNRNDPLLVVRKDVVFFIIAIGRVLVTNQQRMKDCRQLVGIVDRSEKLRDPLSKFQLDITIERSLVLPFRNDGRME